MENSNMSLESPLVDSFNDNSKHNFSGFQFKPPEKSIIYPASRTLLDRVSHCFKEGVGFTRNWADLTPDTSLDEDLESSNPSSSTKKQNQILEESSMREASIDILGSDESMTQKTDKENLKNSQDTKQTDLPEKTKTRLTQASSKGQGFHFSEKSSFNTQPEASASNEKRPSGVSTDNSATQKRKVESNQKTEKVPSKFMQKEDDPKKISSRQKQIDYGKNTLGYKSYISQVPKDQRVKNRTIHPQTPDVHQRISKRAWDSQVRQWRKSLHEWDPKPENEGEIDIMNEWDEDQDF